MKLKQNRKKLKERKTSISFTVVHSFRFGCVVRFECIVLCPYRNAHFKSISNRLCFLWANSLSLSFPVCLSLFFSFSSFQCMCLEENVLICNKNSIQSECTMCEIFVRCSCFIARISHCLSRAVCYVCVCQMEHTTNHRAHFKFFLRT